VVAAVEAGALPDRVTLTPDGRRLRVANDRTPSADQGIGRAGTAGNIDLLGRYPRTKKAPQGLVRRCSIGGVTGMGWLMGLEPTTTGITIQGSTN